MRSQGNTSATSATADSQDQRALDRRRLPSYRALDEQRRLQISMRARINMHGLSCRPATACPSSQHKSLAISVQSLHHPFAVHSWGDH